MRAARHPILLLLLLSCDPDRRNDGCHNQETMYEAEARHRIDALNIRLDRILIRIDELKRELAECGRQQDTR